MSYNNPPSYSKTIFHNAPSMGHYYLIETKRNEGKEGRSSVENLYEIPSGMGGSFTVAS